MLDLWRTFLRLFFRLLYNELAWSYDLVAWFVSRGRWRAWGRTTLPYVRGQCVLELGHGPGHLLVALAQRRHSPMGLDLSRNMGRQARRRLQRTGLSVPLVQARAQSLPFRDGSLDTVLATFPTDFIVQPQALRQVQRVLKHQGRFIVAAAARFNGNDPWSRFLAWLYGVTGQSAASAEPFTSWFEAAELSPNVVWEEVDNVAIMLLIADNV